jgi:hypothetical protein
VRRPQRADLGAIRNFRTPRANLECLYDADSGTPFLYDRDDLARFLYGINDIGAPDDVPRNSQGIALVGDPRNDVAGMTAADACRDCAGRARLGD